MALQQITRIVSRDGDAKYRSRGTQQLGAHRQAGERHNRQQQRAPEI
jgi:hypothetical protein